MNKIARICCLIACIMCLTGCNYDMIDTVYTYDYGYIYAPDGTLLVEGPVTQWRDYEGEQLQIKINGVTYLTSSYNCLLVAK